VGKFLKRHGWNDVLIITTPYTLELIENAIVFIEIAQFPAKVIMDRDGFDRLRFHIDVPDFK
jgi:hypothetical protein